LQAAVTGLKSKSPYLLALSDHQDGSGVLQPLAAFMTNPAGAAIVNATGPIRQLVRSEGETSRRYLVVASGLPADLGPVLQVQATDQPEP
jgi:hypothetical protein